MVPLLHRKTDRVIDMRNVYKLVYIIIGFMLMLGIASAATLNVPTQYKTIQKAVNAAHDGDTINVASGTYKEKVMIADKSLSFVGQKGKYPTVYGFEMRWTSDKTGAANVNGFRITKYGVTGGLVGANTIRNNYFTNCGVGGGGSTWCNNVIMNNQFSYGGISISDQSYGNVIQGNTIKYAKIGLHLWGSASCDVITQNTFQSCQIGVQVQSIPPVLLGNKYIGNKINIKIVP